MSKMAEIDAAGLTVEEVADYMAKYPRMHFNDALRVLRDKKRQDGLEVAIRLCIPIVEAHTEASHLTDGFRRKLNENDILMKMVLDAMKR